MSEAILLSGRQPANKPGTSCLGCRRRKLKCTREEEGCLNCAKSDLPCVYPTPEVGVKRKRGPYKKDKPPRQRHLEDLVKYLEPKNSSPDPNSHGDSPAGSSNYTSSPRPANYTAAFPSARHSTQNPNSEDLVKDALFALTRSSAPEPEQRPSNQAFVERQYVARAQDQSPSSHPPLRHLLEYWQMYVTRVDPTTKIIHCPSFGKRLFNIIDNLNNIPLSTEALLFSIYYAAVSTCTARECRHRFGESQNTLMARYGRALEIALGENYDVPALEALQALVLYLVAIRRKDEGTNMRALFSLAVRSAQIVGLHEDPEGRFSPFEVEMRRRLWFHLYGLESRSAEETGTRTGSIMQNRNVQLPLNLNDCDLDPDNMEPPEPRTGPTQMIFCLLRFEMHRLVFGLWDIRRQRNNSWANHDPSGTHGVRENQVAFLEVTKARLESAYIQYMHKSRPFDHMCMILAEGMLLKARLIIDFPFGTVPTKTMPIEERMHLLQSSVDIIRGTHMLATDEKFPDWVWYFRSFVQWQSLGVVVAELSFSTNLQFVDMAWKVLDPILADWDTIYRTKREEPAWDHVNTLIERARYMRRKQSSQTRSNQHSDPNRTAEQSFKAFNPFNPCGTPINAQAAMPMEENPTPYPAYQGSMMPAGESHVPTPPSNSEATSGDQFAGTCVGTGSMMNFDVGFPPFDGLDDVDFTAFDQVFGGGNYDFLDPLGDIDLQVNDAIGVSSLIAP